MLFEDFVKHIRSHDLTHMYSDESRVWKAGMDDLAKIREEAKQFPVEHVRDAWNAMVDERLAPSARNDFYWKS